MSADADIVLGVLARLAALLSGCGLMLVVAGVLVVQRFCRQRSSRAINHPAVTVLKPLCGNEPGLEAALTSICNQTYPTFQIVFGVQDPADPALLVVQAMQRRFPACTITVVIDTALHGPNRKVSNLINMLPAGLHDILVFSDSDLHLPADYLESLVAALARPRAGLVTTLCFGLPTAHSVFSSLGAAAISYSFLPGALLGRVFGRQDCLGTTMAIRRETLTRVGGLPALVGHLADDNVLGQHVKRLGLTIELAGTVPMTAVPEASLRALWQHELRWGRTIRALEPVLFAASVVQFPIFWAAAAMVVSGGAIPYTAIFLASWVVRAAGAYRINQALACSPATWAGEFWLLPLRDLMSVSCIAASYIGSRVMWRGHMMRADKGMAAST